MIRVLIPSHLATLAKTDKEVHLDITKEVTIRTVLDALEAAYPMLRGTLRDAKTSKRRPMIRFFANEEDWSHHSIDDPLPANIASGREPLWIIGAISGG